MILLNNFGNCTTDLKGSGTRSCNLKTFGDPVGIALFKKGFSWTVETDTLNQATWESAIKDFNLLPYNNLYNFEQNTPDNENATSNTGVLVEIRAGKPQFSFMFTGGGCLHKSLWNKRGQDQWDVGILFETGVLLATNDNQTRVKGFNAGLFAVSTLSLQQGTDPQMSSAEVQLKDANEFNALHTFFTYDELGFNLSNINGVVDTSITYSTAPSASDTVVLKVSGSCNSGDIVLGLDDTSLWILGGTQATATAITAVDFNANTNLYTLTLDNALVSGDSLQPSLSESGKNVVEDALGNLFKGTAELVTLA